MAILKKIIENYQRDLAAMEHSVFCHAYFDGGDDDKWAILEEKKNTILDDRYKREDLRDSLDKLKQHLKELFEAASVRESTRTIGEIYGMDETDETFCSDVENLIFTILEDRGFLDSENSIAGFFDKYQI